MGILVKNVRTNKKSGRVDYRRTIPEELRPFIPGGRVNFLRSLGMEGSPGFLSRYEAAADEYGALEALARKQKDGAYDALDVPTIAYLAEMYHSRWSGKSVEARWHPGNWGGAWGNARWSPEERERWTQLHRAAIVAGRSAYMKLRALADPDRLLETWAEPAVAFAAECSCLVNPKDHEPLLELCRALNDAAIRVADDELARQAGKDVPAPPEPERPSAADVPGSVRVPLLATYDAYAAAGGRKGGMTAGVKVEGRKYIQKLIEFLGHDDAARLTSKDVGRWRDHLLVEPAQNGGRRSPVTVNDKYLGCLRALLGWAAEKGRELLPENVAHGIRTPVPKKAKVRERFFTAEEARKILAASLIPAPDGMNPGNRLARRWIPWLCAYSGARVNEMTQLRGADVQEVDGIWTLRITPDAGTVKDKEYRLVPIHEHLIAQGLLEVVQKAGPGPLFYDPTKRRSDREDNRHFKKVGERLAEWVRKDVGVVDPDIAPNHAWRHTFKTKAVALGILTPISDAITGHAVPKAAVGRTYEGVELTTLADAIAKFPRYEVLGEDK